jgi:hypothetical protein
LLNRDERSQKRQLLPNFVHFQAGSSTFCASLFQKKSKYKCFNLQQAGKSAEWLLQNYVSNIYFEAKINEALEGKVL